METQTIAQSSSFVEQTTLPKIRVKARNGAPQFEAYVNAYVVGEREMALSSGRRATPLYYLSLVAMRGQGTTLQGIFSRLVSTHTRDVEIEGIGAVALAHHQHRLASLGYTLHWNYEQMEIASSRDLHAVIESNMLTVWDPARGLALKQREQQTGKTGAGQKQKSRASLSTAKKSKMQQSLDELRQREKRPTFLLLVPGNVQGDAEFLANLYLSFLDLRVPWPLDPSWAPFLWERGVQKNEIERLHVWCASSCRIPDDEAVEPDKTGSSVPFLCDAYFCCPRPEDLLLDLQDALVSGRFSFSALDLHDVVEASLTAEARCSTDLTLSSPYLAVAR